MTARLYIVEFMNDRARLVKATSQAQAISYVTRAFYTARIPKSLEVVEMLEKGHILGDATAQHENQLQDVQGSESA